MVRLSKNKICTAYPMPIPRIAAKATVVQKKKVLSLISTVGARFSRHRDIPVCATPITEVVIKKWQHQRPGSDMLSSKSSPCPTHNVIKRDIGTKQNGKATSKT